MSPVTRLGSSHLLRQIGPERHRRLLILLLALTVLALCVVVTSSPSPAQAKKSSRVNVSRLLAPVSVCPTEAAVRRMNRATKAMACLTNYARKKAGLRKLRVLKKLNHSSKMKSRDMLRCDTFGHTVCGRTVLYWFKRVGYTGKVCREISENIAWGAGALANTRNIFRALLYSPPHRHTILSRKYTVFGNGVMRGNMKGVRGAGAWTQHFGGKC